MNYREGFNRHTGKRNPLRVSEDEQYDLFQLNLLLENALKLRMKNVSKLH